MFQKNCHTLSGSVCHYLANTFDETIPCHAVVTLEIIIVALSSWPYNEVGAKSGSQVYTSLECIYTLAPDRAIGIDKGSQFIGSVWMKSGGQAINIHRSQRSLDRLHTILVDFARIVIFQSINYIGQSSYHTFCSCYHILIYYFWVIAPWHKTCRIRAKCPDTYAIFYLNAFQCSLLCMVAIRR